jgi:hypothetical protein
MIRVLARPGTPVMMLLPPDEQRDQHLLDHVVLADDQLAQLAHDAVAALLHALGEGDVTSSEPAGPWVMLSGVM